MTLDKSISRELLATKIPPRPAILLKVQEEMRSDEPDLLTLEQYISMDVGISATLVKLANSSFFGHQRNVRSVRSALQTLGLNAIVSAIATIALKQSFANVPNLERFWDSSARIAQISGWLAAELAGRGLVTHREEAYTFGLFRDCGIPMLQSVYADYLDILKIANGEMTLPFTLVEQNELDIDHAQIGEMLVKEWDLPSDFLVAVKGHHDIEVIRGETFPLPPQSSRRLIAIAQLAEHIFQNLTGLNQTCEWQKLGDECLALLCLEASDVATLTLGVSAADIHARPMI